MFSSLLTRFTLLSFYDHPKVTLLLYAYDEVKFHGIRLTYVKLIVCGVRPSHSRKSPIKYTKIRLEYAVYLTYQGGLYLHP